MLEYGRLAAVTSVPDPAEVYPDVAAMGSLAAALVAVAAKQGLVLGEVLTNDRQPLHYAFVTTATPLRQGLGVTAGSVTAQWESLRENAGQAPWPEHRTLIEAAYAEPKLRQLYPYTSHWSLRYSTTTGFPFSPDVVCMELTGTASLW